MSFHSELIADAVWPADIRTALGLSSGVYSGRRARNVLSAKKEVWIERADTEVTSQGGFERHRRYEYLLHVRARKNPGANQTGLTELDDVIADLETLSDRYEGLRPLAGDLTGLIAIGIGETVVDEDPEEGNFIDGVLEVNFFVDSAVTVDVAAGVLELGGLGVGGAGAGGFGG